MRTWTALRWSQVVFVIPLLVLGTGYFLAAGRGSLPYAPDAVADTDIVLRFIGPVTAGVAAYLSSQLTAYLDAHAVGRSWWAGALTALWPVLGAGVLVYLGAQLLTLTSVGSPLPDGRSLAMLTLGVGAVVTWWLVGTAVGALGLPLLAPVLAVVVHLFYAYLPAMSLAWPRQLAGVQVGCCDLAYRPAWPVLMVGFVVLGLLSAAAVLAGRPWRRRAPVLLAGLTVALTTGSLLAAGGPYADSFEMVERRPDATVCRDGDPQVCLWPESAGHLERIGVLLGEAQERLRQQGGPLLSDVVSDYSPSKAVPGLGFLDGASDAQVVANAAYTTLTQQAGATACGETGLVDAASVLALTAGASEQELFGGSAPEHLVALAQAPATQREAFVREQVEAVARCAA